jgi:putative redox protein
VWKGGFETLLEDDRGHTVTVDLPADEGGRNAGTSALELGVLSLAGCISTIFALVARKRRLSFTGLTVSLTADRPAGAPTIQRVHGRLEVETKASKEEVETVLRLTLKTCPVGVLFEQAHIPVDVIVATVPPPPMDSHRPGGAANHAPA